MATERRLIDVNKAFEMITDFAGQAETKSAYAAFWKAGKAIQQMPTVDAVEVVHGHWILKETCGKHTEKFHCSVCNKIPKSLCTETYCPNCGAKMDGDANG